MVVYPLTYSLSDTHEDSYNGGVDPTYNGSGSWTFVVAPAGPVSPATNAGADVTANFGHPFAIAAFDVKFTTGTAATGFDEFVVYFSDAINTPTDNEFGIRCSLMDSGVYAFIQQEQYPNTTAVFTQTKMFTNDGLRHTYYFLIKGYNVVMCCADLNIKTTMATSTTPLYQGIDFSQLPLYLVIGSHRYTGTWNRDSYQFTVYGVTIYPITVTGLPGIPSE